MKTAIVTGGTRGIGKEISLALLQRGYRVAAVYRSNDGAAEALRQEAEKLGHCPLIIRADLSENAECIRVAAEVKKSFGFVSLLVNNAATELWSLYQSVTDSRMTELFSVNLFAAMRLTRELLPDMIERGKGSIVNVASIWGEVGGSCEVHYSASKAAIIGFTKALSKEVGISGVRVNAISPAATQTEMLARFSEEELSRIAEESPLGRLLTAKEVADAAVYLAESSALNGTVLNIGY